MTILSDVPIRRLQYRGYDDPALPVGIWWVTGVVVGDASGGTAQVRGTLKEEGDAVSGNMWNLEQVMAFTSDATPLAIFITAAGLSPSRELPGVDAIYQGILDTTGAGLGNTALGNAMHRLPIWLGAVRGGADVRATIGFGITNPTASDSLAVSAMGYIWDPRSILVDGGPQRPERSLFGNG